uniref:Nucleotide exchange factor Fes1 domain-containing protein n=1 Tax=Aegilops tauschii subsp. strangulata TaxID=200361 RepID=A0A453MAG8_AEGTS
MEAMRANTIDVVGRMKEIAQVMKTPDDVLQSHGVNPENIEDMLDELQEHVESIDMANDLHSIGGLDPLLGYLKNSHAGIRAKAAEVVSTVVQNNPKSQQLVMESNGLEPLLTNFRSDPSTTARTKALGAISSLIRNNQSGLAAFRLGNGHAALKDALGSDDARLQRKALHLTQYLLNNKAAASNALPDQDKLKDVLKSRIEGISAMDADDLQAAREERQLVDSLWKECYGEPSSLREKGLVVLPGEDGPQQPPPDVAGKMFEPPLRAWAAPRPAPAEDSDSGSGKKDPP